MDDATNASGISGSRMSSASGKIVLAVGAHPDDIEFMMAGTLLRLKELGASIHMWNVAAGNCGTATLEREEITRIRAEEARASASMIGAAWHPPVADDIMIYYEHKLVAKAAALVRNVKPDIILAPSPEDYMEDHQNASRLMVTAAFVRGMKGFISDPPFPPWNGSTSIYHAMPYGLRDGLRRRIRPGLFVDIGAVLATKREMLACHRSQKEWLDVSQGLDAYLTQMENMSREVGVLSKLFVFAEGWRRHSHLGFSPSDTDPLKEILGPGCRIDPEYETSLG